MTLSLSMKGKGSFVKRLRIHFSKLCRYAEMRKAVAAVKKAANGNDICRVGYFYGGIQNSPVFVQALNAVGGTSGELLLKVLAPGMPTTHVSDSQQLSYDTGSRMLTYGAMSGEVMRVSGAQLIFQRLSVEGFHLTAWTNKVSYLKQAYFLKVYLQASKEKIAEMWK